MKELLAVGAGSFLGGVGRYLVGGWVVQHVMLLRFPLGTLLVNFVGSLLIGILGGLFEQQQIASPTLRLFLITGVLGGFTTFSAFGYETVTLMRTNSYDLAIANVALSIIACLAAVWTGIKIGQYL